MLTQWESQGGKCKKMEPSQNEKESLRRFHNGGVRAPCPTAQNEFEVIPRTGRKKSSPFLPDWISCLQEPYVQKRSTESLSL